MLVTEARFAAQLRTRAGAVQFFDDLGCLAAALRGAAIEPDGVFVLPAGDGGWTRATQAYVVQSADIASPMGYGIASFSSREAAQAEAARHAGAVALRLADVLRDGGFEARASNGRGRP